MSRYFRIARKAALNSVSRVKVGAVLVRGHNILNVAWNDMYKTDPSMYLAAHKNYRDLVCLHAEWAAIKNLRPYDIGRGDLYVYRVRKNEETFEEEQGLSRPCYVCMKKIQEKGIRRVFYTLDAEGYERISI